MLARHGKEVMDDAEKKEDNRSVYPEKSTNLPTKDLKRRNLLNFIA